MYSNDLQDRDGHGDVSRKDYLHAPKLPKTYARSVNSDRSADDRSLYEGYDYTPRETDDPWEGIEYGKYNSHAGTQHPTYPPTYDVNDSRATHTPDPPLSAYAYPMQAANGQAGYQTQLNERPSRWKKPWFIWIVSLAQVAVFLGQCGHAWVLTGSPIEIKPSFNVMIGPSVYNSISMGARFQPCMKYINNVTDVVTGWPCPNATTTAELTICTLDELCGNGVKDGAQPQQWWRFIVPIFLHAGVLHILFNLIVQLKLGSLVELRIGAHLLIPIYFAAGIGGFLFGGNFAGQAITSVGASGSIFSLISLELLDLAYHWKQVEKPGLILFKLLVDVVISLAIGLLPGVDNFSHIGGLIVGLLLGVALLRSPDAIDRRISPYTKVDEMQMSRLGRNEQKPDFSGDSSRQYRNFFEGRKPWWWAFVLLRLLCLVLTLVCFILLIKVFVPSVNLSRVLTTTELLQCGRHYLSLVQISILSASFQLL